MMTAVKETTKMYQKQYERRKINTKTTIYKIEEDFNNFDNIVKDNKSEAFYSIEKVIADAGEFHVIHLVSINKETLKELRVPLAYYIGTESDEALIEEELLIQEAIKRLYKAR